MVSQYLFGFTGYLPLYEAHPDFKKHTRGYLLHETTIEWWEHYCKQANGYLILKDVPREVWENYNGGNKPKLVICNKSQLPQSREQNK